ncbi:MAG TPA: hypothetical protein VFP61_13760 [Acidimicrobiales bacterium]|nr:hypothetical protein [Acidimicrobiales bacterium]
MEAAELLEFACPRCGDGVAERFYGPCTGCRDALAALGGTGDGGAAGAGRFEPRMHVTPNHVATKD